MNDLGLVEFLRFGSSIPGNYWGCCAGDIIQCFKSMPDALASCQSVNGDGGYPQCNEKGEPLYFGMTNKELFLSRLRVGTFGTGDMENHFFLLVLTDSQVNSAIGKAWLPILKECGFEYIRQVNNSVWNVNNHMFGLFRNCGENARPDQFTPPQAWRDLPSNGKKELWEFVDNAANLTEDYAKADKKIWDDIGPAKLYTEAELVAKGVPVIVAGLRSENPQEFKETRELRNKKKAEQATTPAKGVVGSLKAAIAS